MPNRQVFVNGNGPEGAKTEEQEQKEGPQPQGEYTPGDAKRDGAKVVATMQHQLDEVQELDTKDKPKVKEPIAADALQEWSKGYPEVKVDEKTQPIVAKIEAAIIANIKEGNKIRKPEDKLPEKVSHKDHGTTFWSDNYEYTYIYDEDHKPPQRLFKAPKETAAEKVDVKTVVEGVLDKPKELKQGDKMYSEAYSGASPKPGKHGDYWESDPVDGKTYVVINDSNKYRVYEGVRKEA